MSGIRVETQENILSLVFDRAEKKNAITDAMYGALADALGAAAGDPAVRAILIRSDGDTFTAGNDIGDFIAIATSKTDAPRNVHRFLDLLATTMKPIVAAVQGNAVGIGTTMLLHCDYLVLAENAVLAAPFVNLALVPEAASSLLMPARIGYARAFSMFVLGEAVPAKSALEWGLANKVVPTGELQETALAVARKLVLQPAQAVASAKALMRNPEILRAQMQAEGKKLVEQFQSAEAKEAFTAFFERRKPDFRKFQ